jgi:hypothetical protein
LSCLTEVEGHRPPDPDPGALRQVRRAHQVAVALARGAATLVEGPDHEALAPAAVARREDAGKAGRVLLEVRLDIAAGIDQEGVYVYTLTFNISGTGTNGQSVSNFVLNLSAAGDDNFQVYINPTESGGLPTSTAAYTSPVDFGNTAAHLSIACNASSANFVQGTNTLVFAVDNTGGTTGPSSNNQTTQSGLLVYGLGAVVPEVAPWMPMAAALLTYGFLALARRRPSLLRGPGCWPRFTVSSR